MSDISQNYQSSRIVTYSPAYTLVPTHECFNRCTYCNFREEPGQSPWLTPTAAQQQLAAISHQPISEILILSGEVHPASPRRSHWLQRIYDLAKLALNQGYLPHTNADPLSFAEMVLLKEVNVSMGLMLEQVTPHLLEIYPQTRQKQIAPSPAAAARTSRATGYPLHHRFAPGDWGNTRRQGRELRKNRRNSPPVASYPGGYPPTPPAQPPVPLSRPR